MIDAELNALREQLRDAREPCTSFWIAKKIKQPRIVLLVLKSAKRSQFYLDKAVACGEASVKDLKLIKCNAAARMCGRECGPAGEGTTRWCRM